MLYVKLSRNVKPKFHIHLYFHGSFLLFLEIFLMSTFFSSAELCTTHLRCSTLGTASIRILQYNEEKKTRPPNIFLIYTVPISHIVYSQTLGNKFQSCFFKIFVKCTEHTLEKRNYFRPMNDFMHFWEESKCYSSWNYTSLSQK
jgi:hypothetical protein